VNTRNRHSGLCDKVYGDCRPTYEQRYVIPFTRSVDKPGRDKSDIASKSYDLIAKQTLSVFRSTVPFVGTLTLPSDPGRRRRSGACQTRQDRSSAPRGERYVSAEARQHLDLADRGRHQVGG
jgi:hypothetical protein